MRILQNFWDKSPTVYVAIIENIPNLCEISVRSELNATSTLFLSFSIH